MQADFQCHSENVPTAGARMIMRLYQEGRRHINEQAILIQDVDEGQIVSLSNLVVIMVMGWGDFDSTWTGIGAETRQMKGREEKKKQA